MARNLVQKIINSQFIVYVFRCLIGFAIGYILMHKFPEFDLFWTLLSIILVISPEEHKSKQLSIDRFKSNFVGSLSGLAVFFLPIDDLYKILIGIIFTCIFCKIFNLLDVARSAIVALLIILIEHKDDDLLAPIVRFTSVAIGCFIGLGVTLVTSALLQDMNKAFSKE